jgi:N-carbamoylputrescine amidase
LPPQKFNVGLIQMSTTSDPDHNLQHAIDKIHQASARGAHIVCLPELFQTQYFCQREDSNLFDLAQPIPSAATNRLAGLAKQLRIVLIASVFEKRAPGVYHNTAVVFDADGSQRGL